LTKEAFSDGTSNTYDARGNLLTATSQNGATETFTYDSANRLTSLTDPAGRVESYTYNASGQLATRTEPDGSVTRNRYTSAGQLAELQDGAGNLLDKYAYNAAGQLIKTVTGNGAGTTYLYDADGRTTEILNLNADGSVASFEDYSYNANSQVVSQDTGDGDWSYTYDAEGELTGAVFQSTNAAIQNQSIAYVYDAAGNRVSQTVNGVVTRYTTNALDQYTSVGGTTYTYDADGNMTSETNISGTTTITYNESNQLLARNGPGGSLQYTYDALGNIVATTQNGVTTDFVNDPLSVSVRGSGISSIAQSNNSTGITTLQAYDTTVGGVHAIAIASSTDPTQGVVLLNMTGGQSAANLLASHTAFIGGHALIG
jgi:YD repeat-containing protein